MKYVLCMLFFFVGCSGETFTSISPAILSDSGVESATDERDTSPPEATSESGIPAETSVADSTPDTGPKICPDPNDVEYMGHCFYLDGSKGACDGGYTLSSNAKLGALLGAKPDAWKGKNYRHAVSDNACVLTKDITQSYGMVTHANLPGPFGAGEPAWNGSSCMGVYFAEPKQLTLCESL